MNYKKKLIEVALPLKAINLASASEKSIRQGHPSTLHLWWARRPLASARAVIFAQMVDDPSSHPDIFKTEEDQVKERTRLFKIIEDLVMWDNINNSNLLKKATDEIKQSWKRTCLDIIDGANHEFFNEKVLPEFHDPFGGGGAIPLEAQRLGFISHSSDLNPVAVLINKAMIEIPPLFSGKPPVNPDSKLNQAYSGSWKGAQGLADDLNYYGQKIKELVEKKIGKLYPKIKVTSQMVLERNDLKPYQGMELSVIAWIWARTVKSPNPAFSHIDVPLVSNFYLSSKEGKEVYVDTIPQGDGYKFVVKTGKYLGTKNITSGTSAGKRSGFFCLMSGAAIPYSYIREEGVAGRINSKLMAIVADGPKGRIYLSPTDDIEEVAFQAEPSWFPEAELEGKSKVSVPGYGMVRYGDLFTQRQLVALNTFSEQIREMQIQIRNDAVTSGLNEKGHGLEKNGIGAQAYSEALCVYLTCALGKLSDYNSSLCSWISGGQTMRNTFGRQAIPMVWDYAEANVLSNSTGSFLSCVDQVKKVVANLPAALPGYSSQKDAQTQSISKGKVVSTDPPYYDNIEYADLSDYFYVWMRKSLKDIFPSIFSTVAVPKSEELVASPFRYKSKESAENFFLNGMTQAMSRLSELAHPAIPVTIYYAFKQSETDGLDGTTNTGWDTFLEAVLKAGFAVTGTWPMRTEMSNRMIGSGANALASSIVLVCRKLDKNAQSVSRRDFIALLKKELPIALKLLQEGNIAPVDLAQAAIGPGMSVFSRFSSVIDADGNRLSVRKALILINQVLDESLAERDGDFDSDSRWALTWFEENGFSDGEYGIAEQLSKSKNISIDGLVEGGILVVKPGKVRLKKPAEMGDDWNNLLDKRLSAWLIVHQLIRALEKDGEAGAAKLASNLGNKAEDARELCYRLYAVSERKKRAIDAISYNSLVQSWPEIMRLAREKTSDMKVDKQDLFDRK
jgi:putative DNA methylase